jgi:hypothetical protein
MAIKTDPLDSELRPQKRIRRFSNGEKKLKPEKKKNRNEAAITISLAVLKRKGRYEPAIACARHESTRLKQNN